MSNDMDTRISKIMESLKGLDSSLNKIHTKLDAIQKKSNGTTKKNNAAKAYNDAGAPQGLLMAGPGNGNASYNAAKANIKPFIGSKKNNAKPANNGSKKNNAKPANNRAKKTNNLTATSTNAVAQAAPIAETTV